MRKYRARIVPALAGSAVVVALVAHSIANTAPDVLAMRINAATSSTQATARPATPKTLPTASPPTIPPPESTTSTSQPQQSPHAPQAGDYAVVIPDLSPMITVPADLVPAATSDILDAIKAGWPPELRDTALAIADCESRLDSVAMHANANSSTDYGLFQLNGGINGKGSTLAGLGGTPDLALDVTWNAAAAYRLFLNRGWEPWACATQLNLLLGPPTPGQYALPPFPDVPVTTTTIIPPDTEPPPGQPGN